MPPGYIPNPPLHRLHYPCPSIRWSLHEFLTRPCSLPYHPITCFPQSTQSRGWKRKERASSHVENPVSPLSQGLLQFPEVHWPCGQSTVASADPRTHLSLRCPHLPLYRINYSLGPLGFPNLFLLSGLCSCWLVPSPFTVSVAVLPFSEAFLLTTQPGPSLFIYVSFTPYHMLRCLAHSSLMVCFVLFLVALTTLWFLVYVFVFLCVDCLLPATCEFLKAWTCSFHYWILNT